MTGQDIVKEFIEGFKIGDSPDDVIVDVFIDRYFNPDEYSLLDHDYFSGLSENHQAAWFVLTYHAYGSVTNRLTGVLVDMDNNQTSAQRGNNSKRFDAQKDFMPVYILIQNDLNIIEEAFEGSGLVSRLQDTDDMTRFVAKIRALVMRQRAVGPIIIGDPPPDFGQ